MAGNGWRLRGSSAEHRWRCLVEAGGGGSSENHVNMILATVSTWVWRGRKRARRGTHLGGWDEASGAWESGPRRGAVAELRRDIARARRRGHRGEKGRRRCPPPRGALAVGGGDGAAAERRDNGIPKLGGEGGGAARVARQKAAAAGCAKPRARGVTL
jgi:hypothetical protein